MEYLLQEEVDTRMLLHVQQGKIKPLKLMSADDSLVELFSSFVNNLSLAEDVIKRLEIFLCLMYRKDCNNVNSLYNIIRARAGKIDGKSMLPPYEDKLKLHFMSANYPLNELGKCLDFLRHLPLTVMDVSFLMDISISSGITLDNLLKVCWKCSRGCKWKCLPTAS